LEGNNLRLGVYGVNLATTYQRPTGGETFDNQDTFHAIPQFFYTHSLETLPLSFGVGFFSPFGLSQKWPQDTGFRTLATQGSLNYYTINPVAAWKILPNLSVGAGLTVNYANLDLRQGLVWPTQPFDQFRFEGNGWAVGYNLGVLWQPHEKLSLGVTFRSGTTMTLSGHTEFFNQTAFPPGVGVVPAFPEQHVSAQTDDPIPFKTICGLSYRPTTNWNIEFNADYTDWNRQDQLTIQQASAFPPLLPKNVPVVLNWQSSWYYELGATRYIGPWLVSAGYIFNQNSVPDSHYNPIVPDLDKHFFSVGGGYRGKTFDFDVAYQFGYGPARNVTGSAPSAAGQNADGRYDFISNGFAVSVGMHF
jgi:long-chain fatty acid transport protein